MNRSPLSPRQQEVMLLTSEGMNLREIAAALDMAVATVKAHRLTARKVLGESLYRKMVFRNASDESQP